MSKPRAAIFFAAFFLFAIPPTFPQEFLVTRETPLYRHQSFIRFLAEGEKVRPISDFFSPFSDLMVRSDVKVRLDPDTWVMTVVTDSGEKGAIDAGSIRLPDSGDPLPEKIAGREWILSHYLELAETRDRESLFRHEPFWRDGWGKGPEQDEGGFRPWHDTFRPVTFTIRDNFVQIDSFYWYESVSFIVESRRVSGGEITLGLSCINKRETYWGISPLQLLFREGGKYTLTLRPDGDYLDVYLGEGADRIAELIPADGAFMETLDAVLGYRGKSPSGNGPEGAAPPPRRADGGTGWSPPAAMPGFAATHTAAENLRLRYSPNRYAGVVATMAKGIAVRVFQTKTWSVTIDGMTAPWVKAMDGDGNAGWCFSGYLEPIDGISPEPEGYEVSMRGILVATFAPLGANEFLAYEPAEGKARAGIYVVNAAAGTKRFLGRWEIDDDMYSPGFAANGKQVFFTLPHTLFRWHSGQVRPLYRVDGTAGTVEYLADVSYPFSVSEDGAFLLSPIPLPRDAHSKGFFAVLSDLLNRRTAMEFEWYPDRSKSGNIWRIFRSERGFSAYYEYASAWYGAKLAVDVVEARLFFHTAWDRTGSNGSRGRPAEDYDPHPRGDSYRNMALGRFDGYADLPSSTETVDFPASHHVLRDTNLYSTYSEGSDVTARLPAGTPVLLLDAGRAAGEPWALVLMVSTGEAGWCPAGNLDPPVEIPEAGIIDGISVPEDPPPEIPSPETATEAEVQKKSAGPLPIAGLTAVPAIAALLLLVAGRRKRRR